MTDPDSSQAERLSDNEQFGVLERGNDEVTLRFVRRLPHPPAKVWRALTEPDQLAAWFPTTIEGELAAGSKLRFSFREMQAAPFEGTMLAFDPPARMELMWGDERLRLELAIDGAGTLLTVTASFAELGRAARDGAGWHVCLDLLGCALSDSKAPWTQDDRWRSVHRGYVAAFGPQAATIGPPAEWEQTDEPAGTDSC
jgi:uncharacterized protein YndB with AHSA1/START domain